MIPLLADHLGLVPKFLTTSADVVAEFTRQLFDARACLFATDVFLLCFDDVADAVEFKCRFEEHFAV